MIVHQRKHTLQDHATVILQRGGMLVNDASMVYIEPSLLGLFLGKIRTISLSSLSPPTYFTVTPTPSKPSSSAFLFHNICRILPLPVHITYPIGQRLLPIEIG